MWKIIDEKKIDLFFLHPTFVGKFSEIIAQLLSHLGRAFEKETKETTLKRVTVIFKLPSDLLEYLIIFYLSGEDSSTHHQRNLNG